MTTDPPDRPRVLVVDDDADIAYLVSLMLSRIGTFDTETASTAEQALAMLADGEWDLLLTDLRLPGMDGTELVRAAQALRPGIPAIIMTAHATIDAAVDALRLGVVDFIQKPLDQDQLVALATRAVEQARAEPARDVVLAIGAHPDDVEIGAGGTLVAHVARGDEVVITTLSHGAVGGDAGVRRSEAAAAARRLGARLVLLDLDDTRISDGAPTVQTIETVVGEVQPTIVYTHSFNDLHQDHRATHRATLVATRRADRVYCYESPSSTVAFAPTRFVPIDAYLADKLAAIAEYTSQVAKADYLAPELLEATARYWGRHVDGAFAEPFEVVRERAAAASPGAAVAHRDTPATS